jgi:hypothetical protein
MVISVPNAKDYTGMKFNSLTFIEFVKNHKVKSRYQYAIWRIKCDCGVVFEHSSKPIVSGQKKYCSSPIHIAEKRKARYDSRWGDCNGTSSHPLYDTWYDMKARCYRSSHWAFEDVGAKGIKVCEEWLDSPNAFISDVESLGWSINQTIDRIDCNGNYEPSNIKLVETTTEAKIVRRNRMLTYKNETKTMAEWARYFNMPYCRLQTRINRGWDIERAFNT